MIYLTGTEEVVHTIHAGGGWGGVLWGWGPPCREGACGRGSVGSWPPALLRDGTEAQEAARLSTGRGASSSVAWLLLAPSPRTRSPSPPATGGLRFLPLLAWGADARQHWHLPRGWLSPGGPGASSAPALGLLPTRPGGPHSFLGQESPKIMPPPFFFLQDMTGLP